MAPISDSLKDLLARQNLRAAPAGTGKANEEEVPGAATNRAARRVARLGGGPMHGGGIKLTSAAFPESRLRLVHSSNRRRPTRYLAGPKLVLIKGNGC